MESVIDKLSEIETAASRIMESAVEETRRQDNAAEERTSTYDNDTDAQAARTLEAAKRTLQEQADQELEHLKTSTERSLKHMDAYYKEHKDALCDKIYCGGHQETFSKNVRHLDAACELAYRHCRRDAALVA